MSRTLILFLSLMFIASTACAAHDGAWLISSRDLQTLAMTDDNESSDSDHVADAYEKGSDAMDEDRWEDAVAAFAEVAAAGHAIFRIDQTAVAESL